MKKIAVTGGIGAGKTTFSKELEALGAIHINADHIAHRLLEKGSPAYDAIIQEFTTDILEGNKEIDRHKLALAVFNNPDKLSLLENIIHPLVKETVLKEFQAAANSGAKAVVVDLPLLEKSGLKQYFDVIIAIEALPENRLKRWQSNSRKTEDFLKRASNQPSEDAYREAADIVVENNGTQEQLRSQAKKIWLKHLSHN